MATISKRGKSWFAQVFKKGHRVSKSFPTKGAASSWATQTEAEILSGTYQSGSEKTFNDAIEKYLEEVTPTKRSAKDEISILHAIRIRASFCDLKITDVTTQMIAQYRDSELKRLKPASVLRYLSAISTVFDHARREWQWISVNPCTDVKKPGQGRSRDRTFTDDEVQRILKAFNYNDANTPVQQTICEVFLFALETGMRAGEILGLEWDRIYLERRYLRLLITKNKDKREVPLSSNAIEILKRRQGFSRPFDVKPTTLRNLFSLFLRRSGITDACFHDSRHTAITSLAKKLSPFELARSVGHRRMDQTLAYFNETAEELAKKL